MKRKIKRAGTVLVQSAAMWGLGWAFCLGISRLMVLLHLE